ncbi:unnamed protein product, partial [Closterium sp. NIES-53]
EPLIPQEPTTPAHVQAAHDFVTTMQQLWEKTQRRLTTMQNSQKQYADRQRRDHSVAVGDQVLLDTRNLNLSHLPSKLRPRFCGPFLVQAQVTPVTFRLRLPDTWKLHNAFHVQLLKPYKDPNQQFQGRQLSPPPPVLVQDEPEYEVERVLTHRRRGGKTLRENSQKQYADRQRRDHSVAVGDQVLLDTRNLNLSHLPSKLRPRFCGPFLVQAQVTPVTFRLRLPDTWKLHNAFHVQLLKPYKDPNQQFQGRQLPPPPPVLVQDEPEHEVERVLTHRRRGGKTLEFLLRWKGYDPTEDSWVAEADMGNARRALKDYLVKQGVSHATQL